MPSSRGPAIPQIPLPPEKEEPRFSLFSIGFIVVGCLALWWLLSSGGDDAAGLHRRVAKEIDSLGQWIESERAKKGSYPDEAAWQSNVTRPEPRFYDPWGRPYRYTPHSSSATISTLGRDGIVGGADADLDIAVEFPRSTS